MLPTLFPQPIYPGLPTVQAIYDMLTEHVSLLLRLVLNCHPDQQPSLNARARGKTQDAERMPNALFKETQLSTQPGLHTTRNSIHPSRTLVRIYNIIYHSSCSRVTPAPCSLEHECERHFGRLVRAVVHDTRRPARRYAIRAPGHGHVGAQVGSGDARSGESRQVLRSSLVVLYLYGPGLGTLYNSMYLLEACICINCHFKLQTLLVRTCSKYQQRVVLKTGTLT